LKDGGGYSVFGVLGWEVGSGVLAAPSEVMGRQVGRLAYRQGPSGTDPARNPGMLTHIDGRRLLSGMQSLRLVVRSKREATLQLLFMEYLPDYRSVTYQASVNIPASRDWKVIRIPVEDFRLAPNAQDSSNGFNPERVWMIRVEDTQTAATPEENVLEIDELAVIRQRP